MSALAYVLTFSSYGTHLPGSENGWVDAQHSVPGSPLQPHDPEREAYWRSRLTEVPFVLDRQCRLLSLHTILMVCQYRGWIPHAVHVRSTHIHAVIGGDVKPERMLSEFKSYLTRALRAAGVTAWRERYWTKHDSTRYLWNETSLRAAIDYVVDGQGVRMACYPNDAPVPS